MRNNIVTHVRSGTIENDVPKQLSDKLLTCFGSEQLACVLSTLSETYERNYGGRDRQSPVLAGCICEQEVAIVSGWIVPGVSWMGVRVAAGQPRPVMPGQADWGTWRGGGGVQEQPYLLGYLKRDCDRFSRAGFSSAIAFFRDHEITRAARNLVKSQ